VLLVPLAIYLLLSGWFITSLLCLIISASLWTFKYVTTVDYEQAQIFDRFYRFGIPFGTSYPFTQLNTLLVTKENKKYKAASRSRDYWVQYIEYTLTLVYNHEQQLTLFTMNDYDLFKEQTEKFAKRLNLTLFNSD